MASTSLRKRTTASLIPPSQTQDLGGQVKAAILPQEMLHKIYGYLKPIDVVNAGQVCLSWREAAKDPRCWRNVALDYLQPGAEIQKNYYNHHPWAKDFTRITRFASALKSIKVIGPVKPATRKAISATKLEVRELCVDGSKDYLIKFASRHGDHVVSAQFWNANGATAKGAAGLKSVERLSLCYPKVRDPDDYDHYVYVPSYSRRGASSDAAGTSKGSPKPPPGPHIFQDAELPYLRHLQLLRVPSDSARSLLQLRGASLDSLDTDLLDVVLPLLPTFGKLEKLTLRANQFRWRRSLRQELETALPELAWLEEAILFIDKPRKPSPSVSSSSCQIEHYDCCLYQGTDEWEGEGDGEDYYDDYLDFYQDDIPSECDCVELKRIVAPINHPLLQVKCRACDPFASVAHLAEEDLERFVYTGPYRRRKR